METKIRGKIKWNRINKKILWGIKKKYNTKGGSNWNKSQRKSIKLKYFEATIRRFRKINGGFSKRNRYTTIWTS